MNIISICTQYIVTAHFIIANKHEGYGQGVNNNGSSQWTSWKNETQNDARTRASVTMGSL